LKRCCSLADGRECSKSSSPDSDPLAASLRCKAPSNTSDVTPRRSRPSASCGLLKILSHEIPAASRGTQGLQNERANSQRQQKWESPEQRAATTRPARPAASKHAGERRAALISRWSGSITATPLPGVMIASGFPGKRKATAPLTAAGRTTPGSSAQAQRQPTTSTAP